MKLNFLNVILKSETLILICTVIISSCCKEYVDNDTNRKNLNHTQKYEKNEYTFYHKKIQKQIKELQSENIIYFNFNQYNILPQFNHILKKHANFLCRNQDHKIIVEGHTDERGTPEYNIALGERRANSVKIYLQTQGVLENQISILSYGKEKPALIGHSEKEYSKNRRVVLVY